jgi:hypothetical protein
MEVQMETELMEVWSLEVHDVIYVSDETYLILEILDNEDGGEYILNCQDDEGTIVSFTADGEKKFHLVLD